MLAEAAGVEKIILICGYTDLRYGIDGLAQQIGIKYNINQSVSEECLVSVLRKTK